MAITVNGSVTITGVSVGGLPDGIVDTDMIASNAVTTAKISDSQITEAKFASDPQKGLAKAWINFNGRNTPAARDSYNVASVTDSNPGVYTITFTNAMANANYVIAGSAGELGNTGNNDAFFGAGRAANYSDLHTTTACTVTVCSANGTNTDRDIVNAVIFGD